MLAIFEADEVSKCDISREAREVHPSNMEDMSATLGVAKPDRSNDLREEQPENMEDAFVT